MEILTYAGITILAIMVAVQWYLFFKVIDNLNNSYNKLVGEYRNFTTWLVDSTKEYGKIERHPEHDNVLIFKPKK